jgi:acyl dehydratase
MEAVHLDLLTKGFRYEVHKMVTGSDMHLWARLTGERLPVRSVSAFAQQTAMERCAIPGAYLTGLVVDTAARLAARVPPPGAMLTTLRVHFSAPALVGTTLCVVVTVTAWDAAAGLFWLDICATGTDGAPVVLGAAGLRPHTPILAAA